MVWSEESGGGSPWWSTRSPRTLAAPLHRHSNEDEYSYVLEGRMRALLGDAVIYADRGTLVFKPRDQWHTFWNAGDGPCRMLEIISPGGFERLFEEAAELREATAPSLDVRYRIEFDFESVGRLCREHGLTFPDE
jgi:mannose-6-phosphate isomerase-like protein (cupin superfamily)